MKENLIERQKITFQHLVNETALIRGIRSDVGQIIVRSIKSLGDPKELLKLIERHAENITAESSTTTTPITSDAVPAIGSEQAQTPTEPNVNAANEEEIIENVIDAKRNHFCDRMNVDIIKEYCELFDQRLESILNTLHRQVKNRNYSSLREVLLFLLDELTLSAFSIFLNFVQELVVRSSRLLEEKIATSIPFECFAKLIFFQFVERSRQEKCISLSKYLLTLGEEKKQHIDFDIREYLAEQNAESIKNLENIFDTANKYKSNLSDNRKVYLLISERVELIASQFKMCCATANIYEFHETIEDILKRLSYQSATIFFTLTKKLLDAHAMNIQLSLGRFISVDIFITDVYCLLANICSDDFDSLNEYLFQYTDDLYESIETEFKSSYVLNDDSVKTSRCSICSGEFFM